ncbi:unnamed protein product [Symbiodinium sp. CCMP2592]|nr:unnamed protein product [Symbiodinium sp. CCMP2592]
MNSKFLSGVLSDLLGSPVLIFSLGLMLTGVLNMAFAAVSTVPLFTAIWVLNGLFQGCGATPCNKMLVNWFPARSRGKWWSSWNASHNIGGFLIPLLAGGLAARFGWRYGMLGPGAIAVFAGLLALLTMKDSPEKAGLPSAEAESGSSRLARRGLARRGLRLVPVRHRCRLLYDGSAESVGQGRNAKMDRALYLAIVNGRPFFSRANWREPYRGITQTLTQRSLSTGIYFPLEELCVRATGSQALGGQAGGVLCGVLLNPLSYVKYQMWKEDDVRRSFNQTAMRMLRKVGPKVFLRGIISTAFRDGTFGLCFSLRKFFQGSGPEPRRSQSAHDFCVAVLFAAAGTTLSAPFNYIRRCTNGIGGRE